MGSSLSSSSTSSANRHHRLLMGLFLNIIKLGDDTSVSCYKVRPLTQCQDVLCPWTRWKGVRCVVRPNARISCVSWISMPGCPVCPGTQCLGVLGLSVRVSCVSWNKLPECPVTQCQGVLCVLRRQGVLCLDARMSCVAYDSMPVCQVCHLTQCQDVQCVLGLNACVT